MGAEGGRMDDKDYGSEDTRGHWAPREADHLRAGLRLAAEPASGWRSGCSGFRGISCPGTVFYAGMALVLWTWFSPSLETTKDAGAGVDRGIF